MAKKKNITGAVTAKAKVKIKSGQGRSRKKKGKNLKIKKKKLSVLKSDLSRSKHGRKKTVLKVKARSDKGHRHEYPKQRAKAGTLPVKVKKSKRGRKSKQPASPSIKISGLQLWTTFRSLSKDFHLFHKLDLLSVRELSRSYAEFKGIFGTHGLSPENITAFWEKIYKLGKLSGSDLAEWIVTTNDSGNWWRILEDFTESIFEYCYLKNVKVVFDFEDSFEDRIYSLLDQKDVEDRVWSLLVERINKKKLYASSGIFYQYVSFSENFSGKDNVIRILVKIQGEAFEWGSEVNYGTPELKESEIEKLEEELLDIKPVLELKEETVSEKLLIEKEKTAQITAQADIEKEKTKQLEMLIKAGWTPEQINKFFGK